MKAKQKIDYVSDVHLEFWCKDVNYSSPKTRKQILNFINTILKPKTDNILIIAGDLGHYNNQIKLLLEILKTYYKHIIIVPGNHDRYLVSNRSQKMYNVSENRILELKYICQDLEINYLDGNVIVIDGISFGGTGMWHDDSYAHKLEISDSKIKNIWLNTMNDANMIYNTPGGNFSYDMGYGQKIRKSSFDYIEHFKKEKEKLDKIDTCDVMITHYGPVVPDNILEKYKTDPVTSFYYFDGKKDIRRIKPKIWIHGHSHGYYEHEYNSCKIYCNTIGYPSENIYGKIRTLEI